MATARSPIAFLGVGWKALALIFIIFSVVSYFISLALGPVLFFSTPDGLTASTKALPGFFIVLFMIIDVPVPLGTNLGAFFMAIWGLFLVCMILAWFDRGGFLKSVRGALSKSISLAETNFLFVMPLVSSGLYAATIFLLQFQESQGVQTGNINFPTTNPYEILASLSYAPLWEEFAFRITTIGVVVGIVLLILSRHHPVTSGVRSKAQLFLLAMFSPELAKAKVGYYNIQENGFPRGISIIEWIMILLSSVVFGLAHFVGGAGWEIGKVSQAFLAGFVFALMYVAYGAYASILLHWFFNYYFTVLTIPASGVIPIIGSIADIGSRLAGQLILVVFLAYSALRLGRYLANRASGITEEPAPTG